MFIAHVKWAREIKEHDSIVLVTHVGPLSSSTGLQEVFLKQIPSFDHSHFALQLSFMIYCQILKSSLVRPPYLNTYTNSRSFNQSSCLALPS